MRFCVARGVSKTGSRRGDEAELSGAGLADPPPRVGGGAVHSALAGLTHAADNDAAAPDLDYLDESATIDSLALGNYIDQLTGEFGTSGGHEGSCGGAPLAHQVGVLR